MIEWEYPTHAVQLWIVYPGIQTAGHPELEWCVELRRHPDDIGGETVYYAICEDHSRTHQTTTLVVLGHNAFADQMDAFRQWRSNLECDRNLCQHVLDRITRNHPELSGG